MSHYNITNQNDDIHYQLNLNVFTNKTPLLMQVVTTVSPREVSPAHLIIDSALKVLIINNTHVFSTTNHLFSSIAFLFEMLAMSYIATPDFYNFLNSNIILEQFYLSAVHHQPSFLPEQLRWCHPP